MRAGTTGMESTTEFCADNLPQSEQLVLSGQLTSARVGWVHVSLALLPLQGTRKPVAVAAFCVKTLSSSLYRYQGGNC